MSNCPNELSINGVFSSEEKSLNAIQSLNEIKYHEKPLDGGNIIEYEVDPFFGPGLIVKDENKFLKYYNNCDGELLL